MMSPTGFRQVVFGVEDPRLRATWRFVLAWPLLHFVAILVDWIMSSLSLSGIILGGPIQGIIMLVILPLWARYIDHRPVSAYGVSASWTWILNLLVGFTVALGIWSLWHALAASMGWMQITWSMTDPQVSALPGLLGILISQLINKWVQDVVFFAIILASAAKGIHSRDVNPTQAVLGGWIVAVLFFTAIHDTPTILDAVGTTIGGAIFGLLYVHTGRLALTIGVHGGAAYAAGTVFAAQASANQLPAVFQVTKSMPSEWGGGVSIVLYLVTYLLLVGWLLATRGEISIENDLARWSAPNNTSLSIRSG